MIPPRARQWLAGCLLLAGCATHAVRPPPAMATRLGGAQVALPGRMFGNLIVVEAKWDKFGPYRFLIDTGSSRTLISPALAERYGPASRTAAAPVLVRSSDGTTTSLPPVLLTRLELGQARFENVPALIYDSSALSAQLGWKIDGVLGFSLFRQVLLTLDYPHTRVLLRPVGAAPPIAGSIVPFHSADNTPAVTVALGAHSLPVLIDSGSNDPLSLNPDGRGLTFLSGPTDGPTVGTLTGDRPERLGRLADTLYVGDFAISRPLVVLSDQPATLGGGILRFFTVTFDQEHGRAIFQSEGPDPITLPGMRTAGLSFSKTPVYWRVVGVIRGSPADRSRVQPGDLVTRIEGEVVGKWDTQRYDRLMAEAHQASFTFLNGTQERTVTLRVVDLVP